MKGWRLDVTDDELAVLHLGLMKIAESVDDITSGQIESIAIKLSGEFKELDDHKDVRPSGCGCEKFSLNPMRLTFENPFEKQMKPSVSEVSK